MKLSIIFSLSTKTTISHFLPFLIVIWGRGVRVCWSKSSGLWICGLGEREFRGTALMQQKHRQPISITASCSPPPLCSSSESFKTEMQRHLPCQPLSNSTYSSLCTLRHTSFSPCNSAAFTVHHSIC